MSQNETAIQYYLDFMCWRTQLMFQEVNVSGINNHCSNITTVFVNTESGICFLTFKLLAEEQLRHLRFVIQCADEQQRRHIATTASDKVTFILQPGPEVNWCLLNRLLYCVSQSSHCSLSASLQIVDVLSNLGPAVLLTLVCYWLLCLAECSQNF